MIETISKYPNLRKALKYIILTNTANNAPYHNLNHLLTVTKHCYNALEYSALESEELLMASLFHDYNHSMGKEMDGINVSVAQSELIRFIENQNIDLDIDFMLSILSATQYPYVIPAEKLNTYQKIIRDADLCQIYEYNWIQQNIFGLSQEMNIPVKDMVSGQIKFLQSIEPLTEYGKYMHDTCFNRVLKSVKLLEEVLK